MRRRVIASSTQTTSLRYTGSRTWRDRSRLEHVSRKRSICSLDSGVGSCMGRLVIATRSRHAEQVVDGDDVVEGPPALGAILRAAGDEERPRGHQGVQFVQVVPFLDQLFVGAGAGIVGRDQPGLRVRPAPSRDTTAPSS